MSFPDGGAGKSWLVGLGGLAERAESLLTQLDRTAARALHHQEHPQQEGGHGAAEDRGAEPRRGATSNAMQMYSPYKAAGAEKELLIPPDVSEQRPVATVIKTTEPTVTEREILQEVEHPLPDAEHKLFTEPEQKLLADREQSFLADPEDSSSHGAGSSGYFLNVENELLKNEISVVNNEVSLLLSKARNAEKVSVDTLASLRQIQASYEQVLKEKAALEQKLQEWETLGQQTVTAPILHDDITPPANTSEQDSVRWLSHALQAKQAALDQVTADRNTLKLQLDKTENKYRSDLIDMRNNRPRLINLNDTDDAKARVPRYLQESPGDSRLSRRVKKAYSSIDTCSVRIGLFLRRNPIARIFIICYMVALHLWVLIVLFTYKPEVH